MDKKGIRREMLAKRRALSAGDIERMSEEICRRAAQTGLYERASDICMYMAVNSETDLSSLADKALADGRRVWMPKVDGKVMDFFRYDEDTRIIKGAYDIPEPDTDEMLIPSSDTLIVMPGLAFSEKRERTGYGGGFYDRYLQRYPECMTLAVCFDMQILPELPTEDHDMRPQVLVSEKRTFTEEE